MKRIMPLILTVAMLFMLCQYATAEVAAVGTTTLNLSNGQTYETASSLCWIGDDLYILGTNAVYYWTNGMEAPEAFHDLSASATYQYAEQPPEDKDGAAAWASAIRHMFTDGKTLYGLHPYSGEILEITREDMRPVAQLPGELIKAEMEDSSFFREIKSVAYGDEQLFLLLGTNDYEDYAKTQMYSFNLANQSWKSCAPTGIQAITAGAAGKLALLVVQEEESALWQYDIAFDGLDAQLAVIQPEELASGLTWYAEKGGLAYYTSKQVMLTDSAGIAQTKAYLPVSYANANAPAACSASGIYAYPYLNYVFLRDISLEGETDQTVLKLLGTLSSNLIVNFSIENPDIAIVTMEAGTGDYLKQTVISGDESVDLFVASAPGDFAAMKKKGFAAPLNSDSYLLEKSKQLYPTLQDMVFEGESLLAYPIAIQPHSWTVNETRWKALGLGEYPTTYYQLLEAVSLWLDMYAEDNMDYTLSDIQQSPVDALVSMIVKEYIFQNEAPGERLTFDTPSFRELMRGVSENAYLLSEKNKQWGTPLLSSYYQCFGCGYNDNDMTRMLMPPTLDEQRTQMLNASVEVLFVNAASRQQEAATRFVSFCAQNLDMSTQYMLNPGMNDPYPNPAYESRLETLNTELETLRSKLKGAEDSQVAILRDEIAQKERMIESVAESRWMISPESISIYRSVAGNLRVPFDSPYLSEDESGGYNAISAIIVQYCSDGLEAAEIDAFIKELDRVTYLVYMEGQ